MLFEESMSVNSEMCQFMHILPLVRKFGSKYMEHICWFDDELYGDNIDKITIPVHRNDDLKALVTRLVEGLA